MMSQFVRILLKMHICHRKYSNSKTTINLNIITPQQSSIEIRNWQYSVISIYKRAAFSELSEKKDITSKMQKA